MPEPEKEAYVEYITQLCMRGKSSETVVYNFLVPIASSCGATPNQLNQLPFSKEPLCHKLQGCPFPIAFIYGEYDWVSRNGADKLI